MGVKIESANTTGQLNEGKLPNFNGGRNGMRRLNEIYIFIE
jgi:hypothetical protein